MTKQSNIKARKDLIVILGFDMETDVGSFTPFYEGLKKGTPIILNILGRYKAKATFFFTGEAAKKFPAIVKRIASYGHEVGNHTLFHETIGEPIFEIPGIKPLPPEEIPLRLKKSHDIIARVLGKPPLSFRAPRLFGSTQMINALDKLGYKADASYPLYYYEKPITPYYPSKNDWTKEGNLSILEIPNFADMTIKSRDSYGRDRDQWPLYRTKGHNALLRHIDNFIGFLSKKNLPQVLCFYFHPWEFWEMKERYHFGEATVIPDRFITKNCGKVAVKEFEEVLKGLIERGARFYTACGLSRVWPKIKKEARR